MLWHGYHLSDPGGSSTQTRTTFPHLAERYDQEVPISQPTKRLPYRVIRSNRSVTQLPEATYQEEGTLTGRQTDSIREASGVDPRRPVRAGSFQ